MDQREWRSYAVQFTRRRTLAKRPRRGLTCDLSLRFPRRELESAALRKERERILVDDLASLGLMVTTRAHLKNEVLNGQRIRRPPIARGVYGDSLVTVHLN